MAQHKSAEKRNRQNQVRRDRNVAIRSRMRGAIKRARAAHAAKEGNAKELILAAVTEVQKAASRQVLKKETASRYVSRLMRLA